MKGHRPPWTPWLRLAWGLLCFGLALLLVIPSPAGALWLLAIGLEGFGPWFAALALTTLWPGWRRTWPGRVAAGCGIAAACLALSPIVRALGPADELSTDLAQAFGDPAPSNPVRDSPLALSNLVFGLWPDPVDVDTLVYRTVGDRQLRLDLYRPAKPGPLPTVVTIHGGAWHHGDRTQLSGHNHVLAQMGYAVAAIDYRLARRWTFPAALEDVRAALEFLQVKGPSLGLDPDRVVLLGRSAGGHLALLAAYRLPFAGIRGVIAYYPPVDLVWGYRNPTNPLVLDSVATLEGFLGGSLQTVPYQYHAASPHRFISSESPPTLLLHGLLDEFVSPRHSRVLVDRLEAAQVPNLLVTLPWGHHAFDAILGGPGGQIALYACERFLASVTSSPPRVPQEPRGHDPGEAPGRRARNAPPSSSPRTTR